MTYDSLLTTIVDIVYSYSLIRTFAHYYRVNANLPFFLPMIELFIIHLICLCSWLKQNRDEEGTWILILLYSCNI